MKQERNLSFLSEDFFKYPISRHVVMQDDIPDYSRLNSEHLVEFITQSNRYAIGTVDIVKSTKISAIIGPIKSSKYYQIFLNSMARIISRNYGTVFKTAGDSLFYYFPRSEQNKTGLVNCINCGLEMIRAQKHISQQLVCQGLPILDYRVSADYGSVLLMKNSISESLDLIGSPVNMCAKINRLAEKNQFVIGGDLFQVVKEFQDYQFKEISDLNLGFKVSYPVYSVSDK